MAANKKIAVAVSGGADSLALVLMLKEQGFDVVALTVDHGLRPSSRAEAEYVAKTMQDFSIEHHILEWSSNKPNSGIEEKARLARYELLSLWCKKNSITELYIGHHQQDQAETFLMRLARGSGIDGLASMSEETNLFGIQLIRPLLKKSPQELKNYLKTRRIDWVEDESNFCDDFLRARTRKLLPILEEELGLSVERLCNTAQAMSRAQDYFNKTTQSFITNNVTFYQDVGCSFNKNIFHNEHCEMGLRILSSLLQNIGGNIYRGRFDSLENLYKNIQKDEFKSQTLCDCIICTQDKQIWIIKESKGQKISKTNWKDFIINNPQFQNNKLPSKLRIALYFSK